MNYSLQLTDFNNLCSETLSLQLLTQNHVDELTVLADPSVELVRRISTGITSIGMEDYLSQQIQNPTKTPAKVLLAILNPELQGIIEIGYVDVSKYRITSRWWLNGIWILNQYSGQGIGFAALNMLCKHLQNLNPTEVIADIHISNKASIRIFEKVGFTKSFEEEGGKIFFKLSLP